MCNEPINGTKRLKCGMQIMIVVKRIKNEKKSHEKLCDDNHIQKWNTINLGIW
jgi:hypothetical protein